MRAAVRLARRRGAARVVVAAPVAEEETLAPLGREADALVVLVTVPPGETVADADLEFHPVDETEARVARGRIELPTQGL